MINGEIRMQTADPKKMRCRDCIYRDRSVTVLDGKTVLTGVMKATCLIYDGKSGRWKPDFVVFENKNCMFYERDDTA